MSTTLAGYRFPREVIAVAVGWYLRYGLSYCDVEELLAERGIEGRSRHDLSLGPGVHGGVHRRRPPAWHASGDRWFGGETYVKGAVRWTYLYRAVDQHGQVIDVLVSTRRDAAAAAAREFVTRALRVGPSPVEVTTDRAPIYPRVIDDLVPAAGQLTERYANNRVEADHGQAQSAAATDARTQTTGLRAHDLDRTCLRAEPAPRPLRTHC